MGENRFGTLDVLDVIVKKFFWLSRQVAGVGIAEQKPTPCSAPNSKLLILRDFGRGEWIRTTDLLVPNQAL